MDSEFQQQRHIEELRFRLDKMVYEYPVVDFFRRHLPEWKNLDPAAIVLTMRSATVFGPLIKRAWMRAYPGTKPPAMFNIDPRQYFFTPTTFPKMPLVEKLHRLNGKVLVFDEVTAGGIEEPAGPVTYERYLEMMKTRGANRSTLQETGEYLTSQNVKEIYCDWGELLHGHGDKALVDRDLKTNTIRRKTAVTGREDALSYAKRMRELGEFTAELIINQIN